MKCSIRATLLAIAAVVFLSNCSSPGDEDGGDAPEDTGSETSANAPADEGEVEVIRVATNPTYPPLTYIDEEAQDIVGLMPDIVREAAARIGLEVEFIETPFSSILTGIDAGRFDSGIFFQDTVERQEQVDILALAKTTLRFVVRIDSEIEGIPECGSQVGVSTATIASIYIEEFSAEHCESQGEPGYEIVAYPDSDAIFLALENNRIPSILTGTDNASHRAEQLGTIELVGPHLAEGVNGMAFPKGDELAATLSDAIQEMIDDGAYDDILAEYELTELALDAAAINVATN